MFGQNTYGPIIAKGPLTIEYGRSLRIDPISTATGRADATFSVWY
ncbi:hypothetical protein [Streptomyces europaeiscabiei]|nr:hypothetical protein [Streptomyces europaeiscabiei]